MSVFPVLALDRTIRLVRQDIFPTLDESTIVEGLIGTRIGLRSDEANLATPAGQTALVTSFIVAAQTGAQVVLDIPDVELVAPQPPLRLPQLRSGLLELGEKLIRPATEGGEADLHVYFGDSVVGQGQTAHDLRISGGNWGCRLGSAAERGDRWGGELPFGGGLAGAAVGAEVFRSAMRSLSRSAKISPLAEHRIGPPQPVAISFEELAAVHTPAFGSVDIVSAGALSTAMLYLLLRIPGLSADLRILDDDLVAIDNLNRYLLLDCRSVGRQKVAALAGLRTPEIEIQPVPIRLGRQTLESVEPLAPCVAVGVDDIPSRWFAQDEAPGWLGVASTSHFTVLVSEHEPGSPCARCLHPRDDQDRAAPIPTVSFVSAMAGFMLAYRLLRSQAVVRTDSTLAYPFNLAAPLAVQDLALAYHPSCPNHLQ